MAETAESTETRAKPPAAEAKRRLSRDEAKCAVAGCKRPYRAKGYCIVHYQKWRRGEVEGHHARYKICTKEACRKPRSTGNLCAEHATKEKEGAA